MVSLLSVHILRHSHEQYDLIFELEANAENDYPYLQQENCRLC